MRTVTGRSYDIDIARAVSCFLVVMTHVTAYWNYKFQPAWEVVNFYNSLSRCAVPIFIMISGILLIKKDIDAATFYKKKFPKAVAALLAWSVFYYTLYNDNPTFAGFFINVLTGQAMYHLWYLYFLLGMYLITPIISLAYFGMSDKQRMFFLITIMVLFQFNVIKSITGLNLQSKFNLDSIATLSWYMFVGKYIYDCKDKIRSKIALSLIFICSVAFTAIMNDWYSHFIGSPSQAFLDNFALNTFIAACSLLLLSTKVNCICLNKISHKVSSYTFTIYCIHPAVLIPLKQKIWELSWSNSMTYFLPFVCVFMFIISLCISYILKRIPVIRYVC
ncbi:MAG: acyltransferase family protein [Enterobacter cloacae]|nr:acyltransferase family protein [Enterobacter cloacae]